MISGEIEFRIVDDNEINVENVNGIMPTRMLRKGEIKKFGRESKNQWSHEYRDKHKKFKGAHENLRKNHGQKFQAS